MWNSLFSTKNILTVSQSRFNLILTVLARLTFCCQCLAVSRVSSTWMMSRVVLSQPNCQHSGSIARSAKCQYLSYSVSNFGFFCPTRATRCTDRGEIWHDKFHPIGATMMVWTPKTENFAEGIIYVFKQRFFYTILVNIVFQIELLIIRLNCLKTL